MGDFYRVPAESRGDEREDCLAGVYQEGTLGRGEFGEVVSA